MSRGSRLALATLAVVLMLAPVAVLHPVATHLSAAGFSNLSVEIAHPYVFGLAALALASALPAAAFLLSIVSAIRGVRGVRTLMENSQPAHLLHLQYRLFPSEDVVVFSAGLLRPVTFVSAGAASSLGSAELRAALLHEQSHQRARDIVWRLILQAVSRGFGFVPWIGQVVETETLRTECAADEYAIRSGARRRDLFEAIVAASAAAPGPLMAGLTDANVELRLLRLVDPETPLPGASTRTFLALAALIALVPVVAHGFALAAAACTSRLMM